MAPLGATVNMDGTALYECIGVVFLAQYYATAERLRLDLRLSGHSRHGSISRFHWCGRNPFRWTDHDADDSQCSQVASGRCRLLLAVDRPLDMCRTMVNVWSDTVGSAIVATREGEKGLGDFETAEPAES